LSASLPTGHFPNPDGSVPRFREAGDLTLDFAHQDGRVDDCWLGLHPREFALLWRLAEQPGERITVAADSDGGLAHLARMQARLARVGLAQLIAMADEGLYFLDVPPASSLSRIAGR
jgi:two-component system, OmpR family, response regulator